VERQRLDELTDRWRARHGARRTADRPPADAQRDALARGAFPYRTDTPAEYVAEHGSDMIGFTYDEESFTDPDLDAWLLEVGRLLRERR
jgi:hypothetical protein